jgi:putative hemolysin
VYCEEEGGTVDIRTQEDGGQVGVCVFADSSECNEWAFFRGECEPSADAANMPNPASVYCEEEGGVVDSRTQEDGGQVGVCVFADGSECDEWAFFRGECEPGPSQANEATEAYVPDIGALRSSDYDGWQTYTNAAYGFSLRYPPSWAVAEVTDPTDTMAGHRIDLTTQEDEEAVLLIAFKATSEDRRITPTGMGAGDIIERGTVVFLDQELARAALVLDGKDVGVLYGGGGEIDRGDAAFWINLHYRGDLRTGPGLSTTIQETADRIVASIRRVE